MLETPPEMSSATNRLIALFARAEAEITRALASGLAGSATAAFRRQRQAEIRGILAHLLELAISGRPEDPAGPAWDVVRSAYRTGSERAVEGAGLADSAFGGIHLDTARVLFESLTEALRNATDYVGRKVDDEFRKATLVETLQGVLKGTTREEQSTALVEDLRSQGIKAFRDRSGREWSLANYAAMSARTTAREAHTRGTITRLAENGLDLVKISDHVQDEKDVCTKHEGKIYSISGQSEQYPPALGNLPPYHPNCVHVATPYVARFADAPVKEPEPVEEQQVEEPDSRYTPDEQALFREVTGEDIPDDPQQARTMLHNGDFEDADQDALVALDDKLVAAAQHPDPFEEAGLDKDKPLGQFDNPGRAGRWADGIYGPYMRDLPEDQYKALGHYKRGGYQPINSSLRRSDGDLDAVRAQPAGRASRHPIESIELMDEAFKNAPTTDRPIALIRRGLPPEVERAFADRNEAGLLGQMFGDEAFGSTTMNPDWRGSGVGGGSKAHLLLPKGGKVLPIDGTATLKGAPEDELLLPRGTRYRITGVRRDHRGAPVIEAEIIDDE